MASHSAEFQMRKLLAHHEHIVESLRTTLALLNGHQADAATARGAATLARAVQRDAARKTTRRAVARQPAAGPATSGHSAKVKANRKQSAELLSHFKTDEPTMATGMPGARRLSPLIRHGYLKAKGDGYVRTAKPYIP